MLPRRRRELGRRVWVSRRFLHTAGIGLPAAMFGLGFWTGRWTARRPVEVRSWVLVEPAKLRTETGSVGASPGTTLTASASVAAKPSSPLAPSPPPAPTALRTAPEQGYGLQVAAFPSEVEAMRYLAQNRGSLPEPYFLLEQPIRGDRWYRVRVGRFDTAAAAARAKRALPKELGAGALVVRYR